MGRLSELIGKVGDIVMGDLPMEYQGGDLFQYLKEFFSDADVVFDMIEMNQNQMYKHSDNREGNSLGYYSRGTIQEKALSGLPYPEFTFYETGSFYNSLGVEAGDESVAITSSEDGFYDDTQWESPMLIDMEHINDMFKEYDPKRKALGLTDDNLETLIFDKKLNQWIVNKLKNYING